MLPHPQRQPSMSLWSYWHVSWSFFWHNLNMSRGFKSGQLTGYLFVDDIIVNIFQPAMCHVGGVRVLLEHIEPLPWFRAQPPASRVLEVELNMRSGGITSFSLLRVTTANVNLVCIIMVPLLGSTYGHFKEDGLWLAVRVAICLKGKWDFKI